jgi:SAM-dependent methyltransferase
MTYKYQGDELELFAAAANWKKYVASMVDPWVGLFVLEVGAGVGANLQYIAQNRARSVLALEPDATMAAVIRKKICERILPCTCRVVEGTLVALTNCERFDTILYFDVLEHIEDDREELNRAAGRLYPGGHLVVLAPAHAFLYSPFDEAIGHYRRYSLGELKKLTPAGCSIAASAMLDSVGFFASLTNRLLLRSDQPSRAQIAFWDRRLVPLSRIADRLTGYRFGKTVLIIWRKSLRTEGEFDID